MKYKKYLMGFLFVFSILFTTIVGTSNVLADTTSSVGHIIMITLVISNIDLSQ